MMNGGQSLEKIISFFLRSILRLNISDERISSIAQFGKFCIVGVSNVLLSYFLYLGCLFTLNYFGLFENYDYLISQIISAILGILWAFIWQYLYVFEKDDNQPWYVALVKTFMAYAFTALLLNTILLYIFVDIFGLSKVFSPLLNVLINVPINYVLNKYWAFRSVHHTRIIQNK